MRIILINILICFIIKCSICSCQNITLDTAKSSLTSDYVITYSPKLNPFFNDKYILFIVHSMILGKNDVVCFYDINNNTINIIDSSSVLNINTTNKSMKKYNKLYIGIDKDSLFFYDENTHKYYKSIYPFIESSIYKGDKQKIFDRIRQLKLIENEYEFIIPNDSNLVYGDYEYLFHYSFITNQTHKLRQRSDRFEGYMFCYSRNKILLVSGVFDGQCDFYDIPYIYDLNTGAITDISFNGIDSIDKFFYYNYIDKSAIIQIDNKLYKASLVTKISDRNKECYSIKVIDMILDLKGIKQNVIYNLFEIKGKYVIKKQTDFMCNYFMLTTK
jgi:hypothetical protein